MKLSEKIKQHTRIVGDCYLWDGPTQRGKPVVWVRKNGEFKCVYIQAKLAAKKFENFSRAYKLVCSCGNDLCINPDHFVLEKATRSKDYNIDLLRGLAALYVTGRIEDAKEKLDISKPTAFKLLKTQRLCGLLVMAEVQRNVPSDKLSLCFEQEFTHVMCKNFNVTSKSLKLISELEIEPIFDLALFDRVIEHCKINDDKILWGGEVDNNKQPTMWIGNKQYNARSLLSNAVYGTPLDTQLPIVDTLDVTPIKLEDTNV